MKRIVFLIAACLICAGYSAKAADVKENWKTHCQKCHGEDGKGQTTMGKKLKVKDYTDAKVQESMKEEEMTKITKEGKKEGDKTLMKGFADVLSDDEVKALNEYVRKFKK